MTEQQTVIAAEREEIATRVASFKATQEKFQREREEYFVATLQKARSEFRTPAILVLGTTLRSDPDTFIAQRGNPESRNQAADWIASSLPPSLVELRRTSCSSR